MAKRERLEDLGRLNIMLKDIIDMDIFTHTESKHAYESWVKENHDKVEYGEPRGLDHIFTTIRLLHRKIEDCYYLSNGFEE